MQVQRERDELYDQFVKAIHEVQQKSGLKNILLEKKLSTLADTLEKKVHTHRLLRTYVHVGEHILYSTRHSTYLCGSSVDATASMEIPMYVKTVTKP